MNNHKFSIQVLGQLIIVDLNGSWTEQDDLSYISLLSEKIYEVRGNSWGLLVDMRGWDVQEAATKATYKIVLDRRNQKTEYWIVDDVNQGDFLLMHFKNTNIQPVKFLNTNDAKLSLKKAGYDSVDAWNPK